jgi:PAS domain-containing protein
MEKRTFAGRFISKLEKIDPKQIELFLTKMVQERNFLSIVFNSMLEGVIVTDADLRTLLINRAAREHLGISEHRKMIGMPLTQQVRDEGLAELMADVEPCRERPKTREIGVFMESVSSRSRMRRAQLPALCSSSMILLGSRRRNASGCRPNDCCPWQS